MGFCEGKVENAPLKSAIQAVTKKEKASFYQRVLAINLSSRDTELSVHGIGDVLEEKNNTKVSISHP